MTNKNQLSLESGKDDSQLSSLTDSEKSQLDQFIELLNRGCLLWHFEFIGSDEWIEAIGRGLEENAIQATFDKNIYTVTYSTNYYQTYTREFKIKQEALFKQKLNAL